MQDQKEVSPTHSMTSGDREVAQSAGVQTRGSSGAREMIESAGVEDVGSIKARTKTWLRGLDASPERDEALYLISHYDRMDELMSDDSSAANDLDV